jgi:hypothetical protein
MRNAYAILVQNAKGKILLPCLRDLKVPGPAYLRYSGRMLHCCQIFILTANVEVCVQNRKEIIDARLSDNAVSRRAALSYDSTYY